MQYGRLIKQAFQTAIRHKYLWVLGILATLYEMSASIFAGSPKLVWVVSLSSLSDIAKDAQHYLASPTISAKFLTHLINGLQQVQSTWHSLGLGRPIFILLVILVNICAIAAKAGLISSIQRAQNKEHDNFGLSLLLGFRAFWKMLGIWFLSYLRCLVLFTIWGILLVIALGLIFALLALLKVVPWESSTQSNWATTPLAITTILLYLAPFVYLYAVYRYSACFVVCKKMDVITSMRNAHKLTMQLKKDALVLYLLSLTLEIGTLVIIALIASLLAFPFGIFGALVKGIYGVIYTCFIMLAFGAAEAFISSFWTLAFFKLTTEGNSIGQREGQLRV